MPEIGAVFFRALKLAALAAMVLPAFAASAENPLAVNNGVIVIAGTSADGLRLSWRADYETTAPLQDCQFQDDVTGLTIPRVYSETMQPEIHAEQHEAAIELYRPVEPECSWALRTVYACIARADAPGDALGNCIPALILGAPAGSSKLDIAVDCGSGAACMIVDQDFVPLQFARASQELTINFGKR